MSDLRLKIRNKIYTSGNNIVDTKNNNNAIIVYLGDMSSETLKPYIDNFLKDTLRSQISPNKISFVQANNFETLPQELAKVVRGIEFNSMMKNELYISFVTVMDDEVYDAEHMIDVSEIEKLKTSALGGYSVEIFYDFYGIFISGAKYSNRLNARKTILNFLNSNNGGIGIRKRIFHQACAGDDFYRSAKSITFMILVNLIGKIDLHTVIESKAEGDSYTWTTFALFEKNLASLVIYEMVNKLLENQVKGTETVAIETISQKIRNILEQEESKLVKLASARDVDYLPIAVRKYERKLTIIEKILNIFKKEKISPIEIKKDIESENKGVEDLIAQQDAVIKNYITENVTDDFIDAIIIDLIKQCTVMSSVSNRQNDALIFSCLNNVKREYMSQINKNAYDFSTKYKSMIASAKSEILEKIIVYFSENIGSYMEKVQNHWNTMNLEVSTMINDFAAFQNYFEGIGDLIQDKTVNLLCDYDDILEKIDVQSVIKSINQKSEIYSNILASYYDNIQGAGEIAQKFGNRNITPNLENIAYYLFSSSDVLCPSKLKLVNDEYWFRDYEIAILFTAKNNMSDCDNLPFQA